MSIRTTYNMDGQLRVINPRSASSVFVDLSSNQIIGGNKRFLNNLITNSNVNFNTTANVGRIVFRPNETEGNLLSVYTIDQNDGQGWIFDSEGNLFYTSNELIPIQIVFSPYGYITITNDFTAYGSIQSPIAYHNEIFPYDGGTTISCYENWNWLLSSGINRIKFFPTVTPEAINNIIEIYKAGDNLPNDGFLSFDNTGLLKYNFSGSTIWSIDALGNISTPEAINCGSIDCGLLTTNDNISFNTSLNIGRIVFHPNEPAGTGNIIMAVYTEDESDTTGWKFDSNGNLYYFGVGLQPYKITFSADGNINIIGNFTSSGNIRSDTYGSSSNGDITFINNLALGSNTLITTGDITGGLITGSSLSAGSGTISTTGNITGGLITGSSLSAGSGTISTTGDITGGLITGSSLSAGSGTISTTGTISCLDISSNGVIYARSINMQSSGYLNVNNITSSATTGSYPTAIALSNEFIDTGNSSLDIIAQYIGFGNPQQTLTTASKYMYIKPLSTGDFEMLISNITNKILSSDWATTKMSSQFIWNFNNISNQYGIILDPSPSATYRLQVFGTAGGIKKLYYNTSDELGVIETSTTIWKINGAGSATFLSLNCATISSPSSSITFSSNLALGSNTLTTTGTISCLDISSNGIIYARSINMQSSGYLNVNNITSSATTGSYITAIALSNEFIDTGNSSLDIIAQYIGFASPIQTLTTASKYMYIKPLSTGNFEMLISNITNKILSSDWATTKMASQFIWNFNNASNITNISLDATTTSGNRLQIYGVASGTRYLYYNTSDNIGVYNTSTGTSVWSIDGTSGNIVTIGSYTVSSLSSTSLTTNLINASSGTNINKIQMDNRFFNTSNGSIDIKANYVAFPYITQTLTTLSKYMGIIPQSDGNFSMEINNVIGRIIFSDWTNKFIKTDYVWIWYDALNAAVISLNNLTGAIISASISTGSILCSSLNAGGGNITTTGSITSGINNIQATTGAVNSKTFQAVNTTTYRSKIQMENLFINTTIESIDLRAQYIGMAHPTLTLSTASYYSFFLPFTGGDLGLYVNNISGLVWQSNYGARRLESDYTYSARKSGFTAAYKYSVFTNSGTDIGSISMASASTVAFNTSSDYRLKQDIVPIKNPLERLLQLKPKNYRFIADVADECCCDFYFDGFIAHEIQEIIPMCVSGIKDDPNQMQSIDYSKLTPICVGAIQELNNKVDKMQELIDSQYEMIKNLMIRLDKLENN